MWWLFVEVKLHVCLLSSISSINCSSPKIQWDGEICWNARFLQIGSFREFFIFVTVMLFQKLLLAESLLSSAMECIWMGIFSWSLWKK